MTRLNLARRSTANETLDGDTLDQANYTRYLSDLATVNVVTMTHGPTLRWLRRATKNLPRGSSITILDVGCGDGDLLRAIHRRLSRPGITLRLEGIDCDPRSAVVAAAATPADMNITWRTGDVFLHAPDPSPDFIASSQFTHHLADEQVVVFLRWLERHATSGWFIADLQRHVLAYWGFRLLARVAGWHKAVREDGAISVARGFRKAEWQALLQRAGLAARIAWALPFRLCVSRLK